MTHIQILPLNQDEKLWVHNNELSNPDIAYNIENMPFTHVLVMLKSILPQFLDSDPKFLNILQTNIHWFLTVLTTDKSELAYIFVTTGRNGLANNLIMRCQEVIEFDTSEETIRVSYLKYRPSPQSDRNSSLEVARRLFLNDFMRRTNPALLQANQ